MKLKLLIFLLLILLPIISACQVVSYYEYVNTETASIKNCLWNTAYKKAKCLEGKELVLVPDFRSFTPSFTNPYSRLIVCSKNEKPIWISKTILRVSGENTKTTFELDKEYPYKQSMGENGYHIAWIILFDQSNTDYSKYKMKENLELEIQYSPSQSGETKVAIFHFTLKKSRDIAWPI